MGLRRAPIFIFLFILFIIPFIGICSEILRSTTTTDTPSVVEPIPQNLTPFLPLNSKITNFNGQIVGTGLPANVTLFCNKSGGPSYQNSDSNIGISIPTPWSIVHTNLTLLNILQKSDIVVMEDSLTSLAIDLQTRHYAMQFNSTGVALLNNFSIYLHGIRRLSSLSMTIYNAHELSSKPAPNIALYNEIFTTLPSTDPSTKWHSLIFSAKVILNASDTYNNAFFIDLYPAFTGTPYYFNWGYENDTGNLDNGAAYQYVSSQWTLQPVDFNLMVGLINKTKQASEINLRINGTSVNNKNINDGEWISTETYSYLNNTLNLKFSANISSSFLATWLISYRSSVPQQVNTSFFGFDSEGLIYWNASYSAEFLTDSFDNLLFFDLPPWPTIISIKRNQILHDFWNSTIQDSIRKVSVLNADSGSWIIQCSDKNYVESVFSKRAGVVVSEVNSTDSIEIYSNFTDFLTSGGANLTIFPITANYYDTIGEGLINNRTIHFSPAWCMANTAIGYYTNAKLQVAWFNGTAAGIRSANLTINYVPTNLTLLSYTPTIISGAPIYVYTNFTNQFTKDPLLGATLLVKNSTDGATWPTLFQIIKDYLNGTYKVEILSLGLPGGYYSFSINFSKFLYYSSEITKINITIGGATSNVSITEPNCVGLQYINHSYAMTNPAPYHNSSIKVAIYYYSNFTREPLSSAIITLSWVDGGPEGSWVPAFFGYYNITIDVTGFHSGTNHTLKIQIQEIGYITAELYVIVPIKKLPTRIEPLSSSYSAYKEETLNIYAVFQDTYNDKSIPSVYDLNGNFTIHIENFLQNMTLISPTVGIYSYILPLSALALLEGNTYTITFSAFSSEHEFATINVSLYIIPKGFVNLTILTELGDLLAGAPFKVYSKLTDVNGSPIYNVPLIATFIFQPGSLETQNIQLTNHSGIVEFTGVANPLMQSLQIRITYQGNITLSNCTTYSNVTSIIKLVSSLTFDPLPAEILEGETLTANAFLVINGTVAIGEMTTFIFSYQGLDQVDIFSVGTDSEGKAHISLKVPSGARRIFLSVVYNGNDYANATSADTDLAVITNLTLFVRALPYVGGGMVLAMIAFLYYNYRYRRPKIQKERKKLEEIVVKFEDIRHMNYLLFLYKKNGIPLFEYAIQIADLNPVLIGGFLNAISSFKDSIIQSEKKTQADRWELDYENFKISWIAGELVYLSILSEQKLSDSTKKSITNLLTEFEETFRKPLMKFSGDVKIFAPALKLVQKHLEIDLLLPHQVNLAKVNQIIQFKKTEWALIDFANTLQKELGPFFLSKLVSTAASARGESEQKVLFLTYDLWKRGVFIPIREDVQKTKEPKLKKFKEDNKTKKEDMS